jgi:hypothetical protein
MPTPTAIPQQCVNQVPSIFDPNCTGTNPTIGDLAARGIAILPGAIGLVLFGVILWGAITVFSAGANDEAKKKGFKIIQNGITGAVILLAAVSIIVVIEAITGTRILFGIRLFN